MTAAKSPINWRHWIGLALTCLAIVAVGLAFSSGSPASGATATEAETTASQLSMTTGCYPASDPTCGSTNKGWSHQDNAYGGHGYTNPNPYHEGLKCPAIVAVAGAGAYFSGGASVPWTAGTTAATCAISQW